MVSKHFVSFDCTLTPVKETNGKTVKETNILNAFRKKNIFVSTMMALGVLSHICQILKINLPSGKFDMFIFTNDTKYLDEYQRNIRSDCGALQNFSILCKSVTLGKGIIMRCLHTPVERYTGVRDTTSVVMSLCLQLSNSPIVPSSSLKRILE